MRVEKAKSGHPGMPMGMADVATVLFTRYLKFDPADPHWPDRDRFVLSAGHGSMLLYSLLYLTGYPEMTLDELKHFRQLHSKTPGHPESFDTIGVETTTGPLGQGVATSVGMALAERMLAAEFGEDIVDHRTFVLCSDGDLMEGVSHEAIALAGHLRLNKLIFLFDDNGISIDGPLTLADSVDQVARFRAAGWNATQIEGLNHEAVVGGDRRGAEIRPAEPDRLQDGHRLRRAEEGRHVQGARRAARRRGTRRRARRRSAGITGRSSSRTTSLRPGATPASAARPRARHGRSGWRRRTRRSAASSSGGWRASARRRWRRPLPR